MVQMLDVIKNVFDKLFSARWRRSWTCLRLACDQRNKKPLGKRDPNVILRPSGRLSKQEGRKEGKKEGRKEGRKEVGFPERPWLSLAGAPLRSWLHHF